MTTQDHVLTSDKWGLSAVSAPIRRGTASRLGLRTPYARPQPLRFPRRVTDREVEEFRAAFEYAQRSAGPGRVVVESEYERTVKLAFGGVR